MKKVLLLAYYLAVMGTCNAMSQSDDLKAREIALQELQFLKARAENPHTTPEDKARINVFIERQTEKIMHDIEMQNARDRTREALKSIRKLHRFS